MSVSSGGDGEQLPPVAARVLAALGPGIASQAGPLLAPLVAALAAELEEVAELVADGDGVVQLFNLDASPRPGWLGQFVGVPYDPNTSRAQQIGAVRSRGQTRGTPAAMTGGVAALLTGSRTVQLDERDGSAYRVTLRVDVDETPDVAAVRAAARAVKPVGLVLRFGWLRRHDTVTGWGEEVTQRVVACPMPSETLYPSEVLFPC